LPVFMMFAERTYYAPSLGLSLLLVALAERSVRRHSVPPVAVIALGAWLGASALMAFERNWVWRNDDALVLAEVRDNPRSVRMQLCAGDLWRGRGDASAAREHFERAAELDPASPDAWFEVARVRVELGDFSGAAQALASARAGRERERAAIAADLDALDERLARPR
jgi:tetratricopeptide (TPR) repeat protein